MHMNKEEAVPGDTVLSVLLVPAREVVMLLLSCELP